jgi:hypothetical protein
MMNEVKMYGTALKCPVKFFDTISLSGGKKESHENFFGKGNKIFHSIEEARRKGEKQAFFSREKVVQPNLPLMMRINHHRISLEGTRSSWSSVFIEKMQ